MAFVNEPSVLLVDDDSDFCSWFTQRGRDAHCEVTCASTLEAARLVATGQSFDLYVVETSLSDGNGMDLLDELGERVQGGAVVTASPTFRNVLRAIRGPAIDYFVKPLADESIGALFRGAHSSARSREAQQHSRRLGEMLGSSKAMLRLFDSIGKVAPLDASVLLHGESGTGKELAARALHDLSGRHGRFVALNCGAIAPELLASQLFGHERGAFTGAQQAHAGLFEQAKGGTLFLDEITEMPPVLQVFLLRVLETRSLCRVGGPHDIGVDARIIAACNRHPAQAVRDGRLRGDLYYRLMEFPLVIPPLRERREDIPLLALHFLQSLNERYGTRRQFADGTLRHLADQPWPGNVRELRHAVQRHYILADSDVVTVRPQRVDDAADRVVDDGESDTIFFAVGMTFAEVEREMLLRTLALCNENKRAAADKLGVTPKTVYNRLSRYRSLESRKPRDFLFGT
ncbi:sigma-54-dependent transcriptional regulator [Dokdonella fugitiva]|uniref:sigma-54-dependent transcriptional regulator n=1 Tax=Dokdonella fugitiva TaxID=328517 RepID=UPI0015F84B94|nr:sigma-54 dependent transcriptional regulator [Dokdonella fugitiva]MBA8883321.1 DNA-binding NtrC family response regulator [Dokdonella fugitiva]